MRIVIITLCNAATPSEILKLPSDVLVVKNKMPSDQIGRWKHVYSDDGGHIFLRRWDGRCHKVEGGVEVRFDDDSENFSICTSPRELLETPKTAKILLPEYLPSNINQLNYILHGSVHLCQGIPPTFKENLSTFKVITGSLQRTKIPPILGQHGLDVRTMQALQYPVWDVNNVGVEVEKLSWAREVEKYSCGRQITCYTRGVTASEFGLAIGIEGFLYGWVQKVTSLDYDSTLSFKGNVATQHGNRLEDPVRIMYEVLLDKKVFPGSFWIPANPRNQLIGASPDGVIEDDGLLEIKCPYYGFHSPSAFPACYRGIKPSYYCQIIGQLHITGRQYCDFFVYHDEVYCLYRIRRSPETTAIWELIFGRLMFAVSWRCGECWFLEDSKFAWPKLPENLVQQTILPLIPPSRVDGCPMDAEYENYQLFASIHTTISSATAAALIIASAFQCEATHFWASFFVSCWSGLCSPFSGRLSEKTAAPSSDRNIKRVKCCNE